MEDPNPFQAPAGLSTADHAAQQPSEAAEPASRPWGIYIVAAAMAIAAFVLERWLVSHFSHRDELYGSLPPDASTWLLLLEAKDVALALVLAAGAIGLCFGLRWSWWVASVYWGQDILGVSISIMKYSLAQQWPMVLFLSLRLIFGVLLFGYLFHGNLRAHFRCAKWNVGLLASLVVAAVFGLEGLGLIKFRLLSIFS